MKREMIIMGLVFILLLVGTVYAQTGGFYGNSQRGQASFSSYYSQADFQDYYREENRLETYYPIFGNPESCIAREDIILRVPAGGCQPAVVRSDLLADQNVPVFCQIDAIKINPLINIKQIRNVRFKGNYPDEVAGVGFHPARAALRTDTRLLGSPILNNLGYVVVILKRQPDERNLPELVELSLNAQLEYYADNAFGVGKASFLLEEQSDGEFANDKFKQGFWQGRFFVRAEEVNADSVIVSVYDGDRKVTSLKVDKGKQSREVYVPGTYCQYGLRIAYDGFEGAENIAQLKVGDDIVDVYKGARFLNDKCVVRDVEASELGSGEVDFQCGGDRFEISIGAKNVSSLELNKLDKDRLEDLSKTAGVESFGDFELVDVLDGLIVVSVDGKRHVYGRFEKAGNENAVEIKVYNLAGELIVEGKTGDSLKDKKIEVYRVEGIEGGLKEKVHSNEAEEYFNKAILEYERVAIDYPLEKENNIEGSETFGERALMEAIELAADYGKEETEAKLLNRFLDNYPDAREAGYFVSRLNNLNSRDFSGSVVAVSLDNSVTSVRLLEVKKPRTQSFAELIIQNQKQKIVLNQERDFGFGNLTLTRVTAERVSLLANCKEKDVNGNDRYVSKGTEVLELGDGKAVCGVPVRVDDIELQKTAKVRIIPVVRGTDVETNFTVGIGIEKRAIELTPAKAKKRADDLQEKIEEWERISANLGNLVKGLKGACFATAGVLTVKNFLTGLDGEGAARQKVMNDKWKGVCEREIAKGEYGKLSECYYDKRSEISRDVSDMKNILKDFDRDIEAIEFGHSSGAEGLGGLFGERTINGEGASVSLGQSLKGNSAYWNYEVQTKKGPVKVSELINIERGYKDGDYSYSQLRDLKLNLDIIHKSNDATLVEEAERNIGHIAESVKYNKDRSDLLRKADGFVKEGWAKPDFAESEGQRQRIVDIVRISDVGALKNIKENGTTWEKEVTHSATFVTNGDDEAELPGGTYALGLRSIGGDANRFAVAQAYHKESGKFVDSGKFTRVFGIGRIVPEDGEVYNNQYVNPRVRYFETEPYKGLPAIVPFDTKEGWYAAARQTLPSLGNVGNFESSGRVASFFLCNVGDDGREQFSEGLGDDICQLINLNTGQPLDKFHGLSDDKARRLTQRAVKAIQSAANQYKNGVTFVTIEGKTYRVGEPATGVPGTECAEFMSPEECNLLFNVCDPVICPSSRCDLGGAYPVSDVIQTGIVGSALLCLPNIQEGIAIPVCLTGIQSGIDSYVSILKSHQACLREAAETGRYTGVCDEISAIYTCEFFWRQVSPATRVLLPKLVEVATGKTAPRGGGEYISVQNAWEHTSDSVDYFTQTYAVNSLEAFKIRSTEEAGGPICKAFVGGKGIDAFDSIIEPDSPYQFYGWFSSTRFSDATVPATAQYKVFYHIFAGNDQGISFSVYLKDPPQTSFYRTTPIVQVDTGFIPRGEFVTQTIDFTAPEGYQQMCVRVNGEEQCGFKQVSTDFAVNYLRDSYVKDQIANKNVKSEKECISGSPNFKAVLNPNLQAGLEETFLPEVYDRGVVRLCASKNPGSATDPTRFVEVGYCGDEKLKCWLDKESIDNAITENNKFLRNQTLSEIEDFQRENLEADGVLLPRDSIDSNIRELEEEVGVYKGEPVGESDSFADRIDDLFGKVILNNHKANLVYLKGIAFGKAASTFIAEVVKKPEGGDTGNAGGVGDTGNTGDSGGESAGGAGDGVVEPELIVDRETREIRFGGRETGLIVDDVEGVIRKKSAFWDRAIGRLESVRIGEGVYKKITGLSEEEVCFEPGEVLRCFNYNILNEKIIDGDRIVSEEEVGKASAGEDRFYVVGGEENLRVKRILEGDEVIVKMRSLTCGEEIPTLMYLSKDSLVLVNSGEAEVLIDEFSDKEFQLPDDRVASSIINVGFFIYTTKFNEGSGSLAWMDTIDRNRAMDLSGKTLTELENGEVVCSG